MTIDREMEFHEALNELACNIAFLKESLGMIRGSKRGDPVSLFEDLQLSYHKMIRKSSYIDDLYCE